MRDDKPQRGEQGGRGPSCRPGGTRLIMLLVGLALVLAVGFFYATEQRRDRRADEVTAAAGKLDRTAEKLGDAAQDAANRFEGN